MRELIPYYISRALLAALAGWFAASIRGPLAGIVMGTFIFAGFIWYAHSGWYLIDTTHPLSPLRRDARGSTIRDSAVVTAISVTGPLYVLFKDPWESPLN